MSAAIRLAPAAALRINSGCPGVSHEVGSGWPWYGDVTAMHTATVDKPTHHPRMDALLSDSPGGRRLTGALQAEKPRRTFAALEGAIMTDRPTFQPNDAALELLREMASDMRTVKGDVANVRERVAKMDGMDIPGRFVEVEAEAKKLEAKVESAREALDGRITALGARVTTIEGDAKPFKFLGLELFRLLMSAGAAAIAFLIGQHTPHH